MYAQFLRPEVERYAYAMERTLRLNEIERGKTEGWSDCSRRELVNKLMEEVTELIEAVHGNYSKKAIRGEAIDVGNVAMMISDVFGAL